MFKPETLNVWTEYLMAAIRNRPPPEAVEEMKRLAMDYGTGSLGSWIGMPGAMNHISNKAFECALVGTDHELWDLDTSFTSAIIRGDYDGAITIHGAIARHVHAHPDRINLLKERWWIAAVKEPIIA